MKVLLGCWKDPKKATNLSIAMLKKDINKFEPRYFKPGAIGTSVDAREMLKKLPPKIRETIKKINSAMDGMTFGEFFEDLDRKGEGTV